MIGKLRGVIDSYGEDFVILDVGGVGYQVQASGRSLARLQGLRGPVPLLVETRMREEQITLYGFLDAAERDWFRLLTQVQGVGGRVALALLSVLAPEDLATSIAAQDKQSLTRADGVGPKLAARIVNELRERVPAPLPSAKPAAKGADRTVPADGSGAVQDAISALVNLGYGRSEAYTAVAQALQAEGKAASLEVLVRAGLKELSA